MARAVVVTGATSGIGEATAHRLETAGYDVLATARTPEDLARIGDAGFTPIELELTDHGSIRAAAERIVDHAGDGLAGVIHNAGLGIPGTIEALPSEAWQHQFQVNLFGPLALTRHLLPSVERAEGRLIFVSSQAALITLPGYGAYCASKGALEAAVDALRMEVDDRGVSVSLILPGPVRTRFQARSGTLLRRYAQEGRESEDLEDRLVERPGTVPVEAVAKTVLHAMETRVPKARYRVGRLSLLGLRVAQMLPTRLRDRALVWWMGMT